MIQVSSPNVVVVECITSKRGDGRGKGVGLSLPLRGKELRGRVVANLWALTDIW